MAKQDTKQIEKEIAKQAAKRAGIKESGKSEKHIKKQGTGQSRPHLSVEQKLELSHMLRQEQDYNRMQMDEREMLVYGALPKRKRENKYAAYGRASGGYGNTRTGMPGMLQAAEEDAEQEKAWEKEQKRSRVSLIIRSFLAALLLMVVLLMRYENLSIGGVDYQNLLESLQNQEFINGIDFDELMPYTNEEQTDGNQGL